MDKALPRQSGVRRWALLAAACAAAVLLAGQILKRAASTRLTVDPQRLILATVQRGEFLEYYACDGTVEPATSVYLDVEEGGRVEAVYAEAGQHVHKGDLILRFSNASLQRTTIDTESQLLYNLDIQRNTQFSRAESKLLLKEELRDLDHQILDLQNRFGRYDILMKSPSSPISVEDFQTTRDHLQYLKDKRVLMTERMRQEEALTTQAMAQVKKSIERLNASMGLLEQIVKSLEVRAPISGNLSTIDAQVGQNIDKGQRIGQIDVLETLKLRTRIDQYYISHTAAGTRGRVQLEGASYEVQVAKVYPEVKDGAFEADVVFVNATPRALKRGQSLTVELRQGAPEKAPSTGLVVAQGGFFQDTAGRWVYLLAPDGRSARHVPVRMGRQSPRQVEVLAGLHEGDRIITSGYASFNGVDELEFSVPLTPDRSRP